MKVGGTTIWERWDALREDGTCNTGKDDGTGGMVSFNHYASGAVGDFLYRRIAGIEATEGGYRSFRIQPLTGGNLKWAKGSVNTAYGTVSSEWKIEDGMFTIHKAGSGRNNMYTGDAGKYTEGIGKWYLYVKRSNQGKE